MTYYIIFWRRELYNVTVHLFIRFNRKDFKTAFFLVPYTTATTSQRITTHYNMMALHKRNRSTRQQPWQSSIGVVLLLLLIAHATAQGTGGAGLGDGPDAEVVDVIVVDGFVDTTTCHQHLIEADANGNNDGKVQASEFLDFTQLQAPGGQLDVIDSYQEMPLAMQATFVTLTCLCRDERFGGDSRDVNCCLGADAHIAIVGHDDDATSQEKTRLFATCFLTDQAIVTVLGSDPPSASPTDLPSIGPTMAPTEQPTLAPIATLQPTLAPVTGTPTTAPTDQPALAPITGPPVSVAPTTLAPTTSTPSVAPTPAPVVGITPTLAPSTSTDTGTPTVTVTAPVPLITKEADVVYTISVQNGKDESIPNSAYEDDLVIAMNALAAEVVPIVFSSATARNGGSVRRNLQQVTQPNVQLPTVVIDYQVTACNPALANPEFDRCENIKHGVTLVNDGEFSDEDVTNFELALLDAIVRGDLQKNLPADSSVRILTGMTPPAGVNTGIGGDDDDGGMSGGATAGIVIGALLVAILPMAYYVSMRKNQEEKEPYGSYEPHDTGSAEGLQGPEEDDVEAITKGVQANLGASPTDYGKSRSKSANSEFKPLHKVPPVSPDRNAARKGEHERDDNSSSNAGSSGWSSSAGLSSLNTGSAEDSMDMLNSPQGSSLAAIGAASAVARRVENRHTISPMSAGLDQEPNVSVRTGSQMDVENAIEGGEWAVRSGALMEHLDVPAGAVSRNDLDNAIEAGDWAAVGATAALLAAASDSQSASSRSRASRASGTRSQSTSVSSVDAARAAELDHLVDAGDWEGVVLAAAKFESQEGSVKSGTASSVRSSSVGSETRSGTGSGFTPSVSTSVSESASKARKRDEIRQEVENLVRRVVPEELDNVDEMMMQFKGREEELVETLRTMQERAVAQKARTAGHKAAKQEARRMVKQERSAADTSADTFSAAPSGAGETSVDASEGTDASVHHKRTLLEQAIEAGDWEAVGEAAALMSDTSMTSASTEELERRAAGARLGGEGSTSESTSLRIAGVNTDRARELDELIDRGNWTAVVDAAGKFSQADKDASITSSVDSPLKRSIGTTGSDDSDTKRNAQLKEEEDALAQAEIWMQIAAQSKNEGGDDPGASDAADWAISRSLKSLKNAEDQGESGEAAAEEDDESV